MKTEIEQILNGGNRLKAKEIAKQLRSGKAEINSILHKNKDRFAQDSEYRWSIKLQNEKLIELDSGWIDDQSFENTLLEAGELLDGNSDQIRIIIPKGCNLLLIAAARLLSLLNQLAHEGKPVIVDLADCANTLQFLNRIGFFDILDERVSVLPERPKYPAARIYKGNSASTVEFGAIDPAKVDEVLVKQLTERFVSLSKPEYHIAAFTIFSELIGNIFEHSKSPIFGFAALQRYRPGGHVHIQSVVSDSGLGIANTLRPGLKKHYPGLYEKFRGEPDIELVIEILLRGGISRFGPGRGLGFKSSPGYAKKHNGILIVRQEKFSIAIQYKEDGGACVTRREGLSAIRGTHICFDFYLD